MGRAKGNSRGCSCMRRVGGRGPPPHPRPRAVAPENPAAVMRRPVELPGPALPRPAEEWAGREVGFAFSQASEEYLREMSALFSFKGHAGLKVRVRLKHVVHTKLSGGPPGNFLYLEFPSKVRARPSPPPAPTSPPLPLPKHPNPSHPRRAA